jgi:GNAT superfamily N-acetyltransferase
MTTRITLDPLTAEQRAAYEWPSAAEQAALEVASGRRTTASAQLEAERYAEVYAKLLRTEPENQLLYAIRRAGSDVGTLWAETVSKHEQLWIKDVFVHAEVRHQGIAGGAIDLLDEIAREQGLNHIRALVHASNTIGIKLFRARGYESWRIHIETDPRLAKRRRIPVHKLRPMNARQREAMLARHGRYADEGLRAPDTALTCSAGNVLLRLGSGPDGTIAHVLNLEPTDSSNLGTARLMAALIRACQDRGDVALVVQTYPERKAVFDAMGVADWRVSSVNLRKSLTPPENHGRETPRAGNRSH